MLVHIGLETFDRQDYRESYPRFYQKLSSLNDVQGLMELVHMVCALLPARGDEEKRSSLDIVEIREYISQHFCDYNFSVQNLSTYFKASASNMTHFFKKHTGSTVLEYVNAKRIERAAHLLKTSDIMLKDIVQDIGFSDTSTFIKKFRSVYGMTPGRYRELNQGK